MENNFNISKGVPPKGFYCTEISEASQWKICNQDEPVNLTEIYPEKIVKAVSFNIDNKYIYNVFTEKHPEKSVAEIRKNYKNVITKLKKAFDSMIPYENNTNYLSLNTIFRQVVKSRGRRFEKDTKGFQGMPKIFRGLFCKGFYYDLDVKNAHPTFLHQFIEKSSIGNNPSLTKYINNREPILADMVKQGISNRAEAKDTLLAIMNGDEVKNFKLKKIPFVMEYLKDMRKTLDSIYDLCENNSLFKKYKSRKPTNQKGSTINNILTDIENWVLYCIYNRLIFNGYCVDTLCHDGCMIRGYFNEETGDFEKKSDFITNKDIQDICEFVLSETGYKIQLEIKPFDTSLDMDKLSQKDDIDEIPTNTDILDTFYKVKGESDVSICNNGKIFIFNLDSGLWEDTPKNSLGSFICRFMTEYYEKNLHDLKLIKAIQITKLKKSGCIKELGSQYYNDIKFRATDDFMEILNSIPYLIPFKNNVVDIRTGTFRKIFKNDYFSYTINRDLQHEVSDEIYTQVEKFIQSFFMVPQSDETYILDEETYECFNMILGYALTGYTNNKCLFFLIGESNSGKSTLIKLLEKTLNSNNNHYVKPVHKRLFIGKQNNIEAEFSALENNLRIGHCCEFSENDVLNGDVVKKITGNDTISYRPFNSDIRTINGVKTKFFISTNEFPHFKAYDSGLDTRLVYIPFKNKFDPVSGSKKVEKFMDTKLDVFFSYLVNQACIFYKNGMKINKSQNMLEIKQEIKNEKNELYSFYEMFEPLENDKNNDFIPNWELRQLYLDKFPKQILTQRQFDLYAKSIFKNFTSTDRVIKTKRTKLVYGYKLIQNNDIQHVLL